MWRPDQPTLSERFSQETARPAEGAPREPQTGSHVAAPEMPDGNAPTTPNLIEKVRRGAAWWRDHQTRNTRRDAIRSYSRFVFIFKMVLPGVALLLLLAIVIWPQIRSLDNRFQIGFSNTEAREAADLNMVNARYLGVDGQARPYTITADLARNLPNNSSVVTLEIPKADLTLEDGSWMMVTADSGRYDQNDKLLMLKGSVNLFHDSGYEILTSSAALDLKSGAAAGNQPVAGRGPFGDLQSQGFQMLGRGAVIVFTGKAHLKVYPYLERSQP